MRETKWQNLVVAESKPDHPPIAPGTSDAMARAIKYESSLAPCQIDFMRDNQIAAWMRVAWDAEDNHRMLCSMDMIDGHADPDRTEKAIGELENRFVAEANARAWDRWGR
jgi:hypothetical protein